MSDEVIRIEHVGKQYRLGAINSATLKGDLMSLAARITGKDDPNMKLGYDIYTKNQRFVALDDVNLSVKRGERVGIIGHNGAGKSTLLKLLSRVTLPTSGVITYKGRVASMLEVGTGFDYELTGRENIYLNGAILGMKKAEIDAKFDDIVRFSEIEQFIDTPVKRYSSGMYVKLAFAVAAHLDSEIMIMDEVLAVGDVMFQQKCLGKMDDVSKSEGRTILYVSHNMSTIRRLCTRCVLLDHGKVKYDGSVEEATRLYTGDNDGIKTVVDMNAIKRDEWLGSHPRCKMLSARIVSHPEGIVRNKERIELELSWENRIDSNVKLRVEYRVADNCVATALLGKTIPCRANTTVTHNFALDVSNLVGGIYTTMLVLYEDYDGSSRNLDYANAVVFEKVIDGNDYVDWQYNRWGYVRVADVELIDAVTLKAAQ